MNDRPRIYDEPSDVSAEDDEVIVDGPDGVAVSMTPEAATETGDRLIDQAAIARGKHLIEKKRKGG